MSRLFKVSLTGLIVLAAGLSGCGGGKSVVSLEKPKDTTTTPASATSRTITGKVVSTASGNPGLANIMVIIGNGHSAETSADGKFTITFSATDEIAPTFSVDAAGNVTDEEEMALYNGQRYYKNVIDLPVDARNVTTTADLGVIQICSGPDATPIIPSYPDKDTIISGRIVKASSETTGIAGVTVNFGDVKQFSVKSGADGYFAINIGRNTIILSLFSSASMTFSIDTSTAGTDYPNNRGVTYGDQSYYQSSISVPDDVLMDKSNDLGKIYYQDVTPTPGDSTNPTNPPDRPIFPLN